jgi:hypothetical protein
MNKKALIRWILFLSVGFPFQFIVYAIYPLLWVYWRIFIFKKTEKLKPVHWEPDFETGRATKLNGLLLDNDDDHGALTQYGFIQPEGLELLVDKEGNFVRGIDYSQNLNMNYVSGDCVVAWCFAYSLIPDDKRDYKLIEKVAWNYLKYLGSRSWDELSKGDVSNRCNNFGINYCPDSDLLKLGQPMAGPQFYTSSALFALAAKKSLFFKFVFWIHWVLLGGWYWAWWPVINPKDQYWYVFDITMKALWVHRDVFGNRWWIKVPMEKIREVVPARNDLFEAMVGNEPSEMPNIVHAFFSQEKTAESSKELFEREPTRASAYIKDAVWKIYQKNKNF